MYIENKFKRAEIIASPPKARSKSNKAGHTQITQQQQHFNC